MMSLHKVLREIKRREGVGFGLQFIRDDMEISYLLLNNAMSRPHGITWAIWSCIFINNWVVKFLIRMKPFFIFYLFFLAKSWAFIIFFFLLTAIWQDEPVKYGPAFRFIENSSLTFIIFIFSSKKKLYICRHYIFMN